MRYRLALVFVGLVALGAVGSSLLGAPGPANAGPPPQHTLVQPNGSDDVFWPYTSTSYSVEGKTLAMNVLVVGDPQAVQRSLTDRSSVEWHNPARNESRTATIGASPWASTHGAHRYSYVAKDRGARGRWVDADYQLATGSYFGHRTHVRAYPGPNDRWTAIQAHNEYWDWFRLRHTVTDVESAAEFVKDDLAEQPFVGDVEQYEYGTPTAGSDGSIPVVRLGPAAPSLVHDLPAPARGTPALGQIIPALVLALPAFGLAVAIRRPNRRVNDVLLPVSIVVIVLGVRASGIVAQALFPTVTPKLFAGLLYPVLAAGPLVAAGVLARHRPSVRVAVFAAAGFAVALVLDMGTIGVTAFPAHIAMHRIALIGALGLFTHGIARSDRRIAGGGVAIWVALLAATLLGIV